MLSDRSHQITAGKVNLLHTLNTSISETVKTSTKYTEQLLYIWIFTSELPIGYSKAYSPLRKLHLMTLIYFFEWNENEIIISQKHWELAHTYEITKYLAIWQHFSFLKCKWSLNSYCRFASICAAPTFELLLS